MGKKIKVVDITPEETTTQSEQVDDVPLTVDDVPPTVDDVPPTVDEPVVDVLVETAPAPKPRAKPKKLKKDVLETAPAVQEEPVQQVKEEVEEIKEEPKSGKVKKVVEQVKCPKCDKMMSQKSLRYTHEQNCKGTVVKTEELPVKRRIKKEANTTTTATTETSRPTHTNKKELYNSIVSKNVSVNSSEIDIPDNLRHEILKTIQRQQIRKKMKEDNLNRLRMQIA
jgi:cytochrome c-type biogenesis protein CcmH/NrfF